MKSIVIMSLVALNLSGCMVAAGLGSVALLEQLIPATNVFTEAEEDFKNSDKTEFNSQMNEFRRIQKLHAQMARESLKDLEATEKAASSIEVPEK